MTKHVNLRLPDDVHAKVKDAAARERRSLNAMLIVLVERALNAHQDRPTSPPH